MQKLIEDFTGKFCFPEFCTMVLNGEVKDDILILETNVANDDYNIEKVKDINCITIVKGWNKNQKITLYVLLKRKSSKFSNGSQEFHAIYHFDIWYILYEHFSTTDIKLTEVIVNYSNIDLLINRHNIIQSALNKNRNQFFRS